jgi:hypothetical protein
MRTRISSEHAAREAVFEWLTAGALAGSIPKQRRSVFLTLRGPAHVLDMRSNSDMAYVKGHLASRTLAAPMPFQRAFKCSKRPVAQPARLLAAGRRRHVVRGAIPHRLACK